MALHWDLTKVQNNKKVCWVRRKNRDTGKMETRMNPVTSSIIWFTILAGIGRLTEKTVPLFFCRLRAWERCHGASLLRGKKGYFITLEDIQKHEGLSTNVFPQESDNQFLKRLGKSLMRDVSIDLRNERKALEKKQAEK